MLLPLFEALEASAIGEGIRNSLWMFPIIEAFHLIGLAVIGGWRSTTGLLVGTVVFAVGQAMTYPSAMLLALESASANERSAAVGSVGAAVDVALGLGAVTLGGVAKFIGYDGAFLVASAVALSGLAILRPMRPPARIPLEEPAR